VEARVWRPTFDTCNSFLNPRVWTPWDVSTYEVYPKPMVSSTNTNPPNKTFWPTNWGQSEPAPTSAPVGRFVHRTGCVSSFSSWFSSWPCVDQYCTTVNFVLVADLWHLFVWVFFFPNHDHTTLEPSYPTNLDTLLIYILALPTNPLTTYPLSFHC